MNIAIVGTGTMGRIVRDMALQNSMVQKVYNIEPALGETLWDIDSQSNRDLPDIIIDFSHPDALSSICSYAYGRGEHIGVVFATTGYSKEKEEEINKLSQSVPIIKSSNYSYGINAMKKIIEFASPYFEKDCDFEIIEKHHNLKVDAPSGTATLFVNTLDPTFLRKRKYGRKGEEKRKNEIGIHSIRGGTIFGEHTVIFAMKDEVIELKHTAFSKKIFAKGAIEAAIWLNGKEPGLYSLDDVFYS